MTERFFQLRDRVETEHDRRSGMQFVMTEVGEVGVPSVLAAQPGESTARSFFGGSVILQEATRVRWFLRQLSGRKYKKKCKSTELR